MRTNHTDEYRKYITAAASRWVERMQNPSALDHAEFAAWLAQDPAQLSEYLEMVEVDRCLYDIDSERTLDVDAMLRRMERTPFPALTSNGAFSPRQAYLLREAYRPRASKLSSRLRLPAIVASLAVFVLVIFLIGLHDIATYETSPGENRVVILGDGSRVHLNSATRIRVRFHDQLRELELLQGQAMFDVAHDRSHPFRVLARGAIAQALGTQFDVRLDADTLAVTVRQGRVAVLARGDATLPTDRLEIGKSETAVVDLDRERRVVVRKLSDVQARSAWAWTGRVQFDGMSLRDIVTRFNRANVAQIVFDDPTLADERLGGNSDLMDVETFAEHLSSRGIAVSIASAHGGRVFHLSRAVPAARREFRRHRPSRACRESPCLDLRVR